MRKITEEVYIWLSILDELEYMTFILLIKAYESTINLYNYSKDIVLFEKILNQNNIKLNLKLKSSILDSSKKIVAHKIYNYFKEKNISIIPFNSKLYPKRLKNIYSPPICLFVCGNVEKLNNKKIYVYENNNISEYAKKITKYLYNSVINKNEVMLLNNNLKIDCINLENEYKNIVLNPNCLSIYFGNNEENKKMLRKYEVIAGIIDLLVIPEADYNKEIAILVDCILENENNICVFPNEIFNKNAYFSNYLIKNGANVIINCNELKKIIGQL